MNWSRDISAAPRGRFVKADRIIASSNGKVTREFEVFERDHVILASKCGKVIASYWIPDEERWCMFKKGEEPVAWMPWPDHPGSAGAVLHDQPSEFERLCKAENNHV